MADRRWTDAVEGSEWALQMVDGTTDGAQVAEGGVAECIMEGEGTLT